MKIIGITGGVGSGKSEVLNILENDYNAHILMADLIAHQLMEVGQPSYEEICKTFGDKILNEDQTINREALGRIVFSDADKLSQLNAITHGQVDAEITKRLDEMEGTDALVVIEAALLVGAGYEKRFDSLWYIYAREDVRRERLKASRGYSDEKIDQMLKSQSSEEEFRRVSTEIIDNSGDIKYTKEQIAKLLKP